MVQESPESRSNEDDKQERSVSPPGSLEAESCLDRHDWHFRWKNACDALGYLSRLPRAHFREKDKGTERFLVGALAVVAALLFTPAEYLSPMILFCDILFGTTLLMFITHRFGVLNTLNAKQAALVWDLIVSISLFVVFVVVHLTAVYFILRYSVRI